MLPRLLILQPNLNPPGGGAGVAAWALEALKEHYRIDLLTWRPVDLHAINRFYGTRLDPSEFRILGGPRALHQLLRACDPDPDSIQSTALLMRVASLLRRRYAASLSFCNETDFGGPVIQYIHFPYLHGRLSGAGRWWPLWGGDAQRRSTRLRPWRLLSGFDPGRMRANPTLVNSDWTGQVVRDRYGIEPTTLYPPVVGGPPSPWESRGDVFLSVGRLSGEKRWELALEILREVRARGHAIRWQLIGTATGRASDRGYEQRIRRLVADHGEWAEFRDNVSRDEMLQIIARSRYGLHAMAEEHFGMGVSELALGGCLVFVPDGGGQREIVANEPRLVYGSMAEAVERIVHVLEHDETRRQLRARLAAHVERFSTEAFQRRLRSVVARHVSQHA